jgi:hypothetical protein
VTREPAPIELLEVTHEPQPEPESEEHLHAEPGDAKFLEQIAHIPIVSLGLRLRPFR